MPTEPSHPPPEATTLTFVTHTRSYLNAEAVCDSLKDCQQSRNADMMPEDPCSQCA